ncbi:hypothetical protein AB0M95_36925 [Sphaerisporangium sp. NPDC051017]|uniref:hypothetical protein n=1 Tax=Sphaerisporangium sp. NPDC051017 TaxID=3154636 RepID=UPI00341E1F78
MYAFNVYHCRKTVGRLAKALTATAPRPHALIEDYRKAINQFRPIAAPMSTISIGFEDSSWGQHIAKHDIFSDFTSTISPSAPQLRAFWARCTTGALEHIRSTDSNIASMIDLLVTDIIILNTKYVGGRTASHIPGLVCLSPSCRWQKTDFADMIVYEAFHLNLFISDMVYGVFSVPRAILAEEQNHISSPTNPHETIPLDQALHGAVAVMALMYVQSVRGKSSLLEMLATPLSGCIEELCARAQFLSDYGREMINQLATLQIPDDIERLGIHIAKYE